MTPRKNSSSRVSKPRAFWEVLLAVYCLMAVSIIVNIAIRVLL